MSNSSFIHSIKKNITALIGLLIIIIFSLIALLGYWVMPDNTPMANDRIPEIRKLPPGAEVTLLLTKKNSALTANSIWQRYIKGQPAQHISKAITSYSYTQEGDLVYVPYGFINKQDTISADNVNNSIKIETKKYWLGTDKSGRDLLSMLIYGARISLMVGIIAVSISLFIGIVLGGLAGYYRGWVDTIILWVISVIWSVPGILLVIGISLALQSKGVWVAFLAVGLTMWVEVARVVRGQVMEVREKQYVIAAKALGFSDLRIVFKHILPNIIAPIIVIATANFASSILVESGLSFLGLGAQPPTPSWGQLVRDGYQLMGNENSWHILTLPCVCISLLVLSFNLIGNALRDWYSPK